MTPFEHARQNMGDSDAEKAALLIALAIREAIAPLIDELSLVASALDAIAEAKQKETAK